MPGDEATDLPRRRRGLQELPSHLIYPLPAILRAIHYQLFQRLPLSSSNSRRASSSDMSAGHP